MNTSRFSRALAVLVIGAFLVPTVSFAQTTQSNINTNPTYVALLVQILNLLKEELQAIQQTQSQNVAPSVPTQAPVSQSSGESGVSAQVPPQFVEQPTFATTTWAAYTPATMTFTSNEPVTADIYQSQFDDSRATWTLNSEQQNATSFQFTENPYPDYPSIYWKVVLTANGTSTDMVGTFPQ